MKLFFLIYSVLIPFLASSVSNSKFSVNTDTNAIIDEKNRERFFHGINVVIKSPPYFPNINIFQAGNSITPQQMDEMVEWGGNVIRLGIYK